MTALSLAETTNATEYLAAGGGRHDVANQRILSKLVEREVIHCVSCLVSHFAQNPDACTDGIDYDEILSMCSRYPDNSDEIDDLRGEIDDLQAEIEDLESQIEDLGDEADEGDVGALQSDIAKVQEDIDLKESQISDLESEQKEPLEAYEHWAVSRSLGEDLAEHGQMVGELFDFSCIWGRPTSGQSISLDYVIFEIAAEMQILSGQKYDWKE